MKRIALVFTALVFGLTLFAGTAAAKKRGCKARYTLGSKTTPFYYLGKVGGFFRNKKKLCLRLATAKAKLYVKRLFPKSTSLCGKRYRVYIDTEVAGKKNSRDGNVYVLNGGYTCYKYCACPRGYKRKGNVCYRTSAEKISSCKLPTDAKFALPYINRGGYLYKIYSRKVNAKCGWRIR